MLGMVLRVHILISLKPRNIKMVIITEAVNKFSFHPGDNYPS